MLLSPWEDCLVVPSPTPPPTVAQLSTSLSLQMYLRELLRLMHVRFFHHLAYLGEDGLQMLFCHRWILLCFKREFPDAEALRIWEACWAHYQVRPWGREVPHCWRLLCCFWGDAGWEGCQLLLPVFHSLPSPSH